MNLILTLSYLLFIFLFFCRKNNTLKNLVITTSLLKKERNISEILQWIPTTSPTLEEEIGEKRKAQPITKKKLLHRPNGESFYSWNEHTNTKHNLPSQSPSLLNIPQWFDLFYFWLRLLFYATSSIYLFNSSYHLVLKDIRKWPTSNIIFHKYYEL